MNAFTQNVDMIWYDMIRFCDFSMHYSKGMQRCQWKKMNLDIHNETGVLQQSCTVHARWKLCWSHVARKNRCELCSGWALSSPAIPAFIKQDRSLRSVWGFHTHSDECRGESFRKVLESLTAYLGEVYIHVHIHRLSWTCICKFISLACWKTSSFDRSNWQVICQRTSCASNLWWRQTMPPIPSDPTLRKLTSPQVKIVQSGPACFLHVLDSCI